MADIPVLGNFKKTKSGAGERFQRSTTLKTIIVILAILLTFPQGQMHHDTSSRTIQLRSCALIRECGNMLQHLVLIQMDLSLFPVNLILR